jgi:predicted ATPase
MLFYESKGSGAWTWTLDSIRSQSSTENVIKLLTETIETFKDDTRIVLQIASCIGNRFDSAILSDVSQIPIKKIDALLRELVKHRFIEYAGYGAAEFSTAKGKRLSVKQYRFPHDRIRKAAYESISKPEKEQYHLLIGNYLQKHIPQNRLNELDPAESLKRTGVRCLRPV